MWSPPPPEPPPAGWWTGLETAEQWETRRWVDGIADGLRAERIEGLRARVHEVDMRAAGALARDRWRRIERRHVEINGWDERFQRVRSPAGDRVEGLRAREVEHRGGGWILSVEGKAPDWSPE